MGVRVNEDFPTDSAPRTTGPVSEGHRGLESPKGLRWHVKDLVLGWEGSIQNLDRLVERSIWPSKGPSYNKVCLTV